MWNAIKNNTTVKTIVEGVKWALPRAVVGCGVVQLLYFVFSPTILVAAFVAVCTLLGHIILNYIKDETDVPK